MSRPIPVPEDDRPMVRPARTPFSSSARIVVGLALLALVGLASNARVGGGGTAESTTALVAISLLGVGLVTALATAGMSVGGYALLRDTRLSWKLVVIAGAFAAAATLVGLLLFVGRLRDPAAEYHAICLHGTLHMARNQWAVGEHWGDRGFGGKLLDTGAPCHQGTGARRGEGLVDGGGKGGKPLLFLAVAGGTVFVLLAGAGLAALTIRRRRGLRASENEQEALLGALDESLDDLRRERDIRRAIIACYARMERALDRSGAPRRPQETPVEYLGRVLERIAAEPGRRLTELFERAKFSLEQMGERDKNQAIAALEALRAGVSA
jgi:hypothetical protein